MDMKRIALISITLFILILGISCASAATVDHGVDSTLKKDCSGSAVKVVNPSVKTVSNKAVKKVTKKTLNKSSKKSNKAVKKVALKKTVRPVDKIINGWNPKKHQVSCKSMGGGLYMVYYDDGYHRLIDSKGNILSYGY